MDGGPDIEEVHRRLSQMPRFSSVEFVEYPEDGDDAVFSATLAPGPAAEILDGLKKIPGAGEGRPSDDRIESVIRAVLAPGLPPDLDITIEMNSGFGYLPGEELAPETVDLYVRLPKQDMPAPAAPAAAPRPPAARVPLSEAAQKEESRREKVRNRAQRRRDTARAKKEAKTGRPVRVGKVGYVTKVFDTKTGLDLWVPTTAKGRAVMREADRVFKKGVETGGALARHLNALKLKPLQGKTFTRTMMTRVLRALGRYRRSRAVRRLHRTAR